MEGVNQAYEQRRSAITTIEEEIAYLKIQLSIAKSMQVQKIRRLVMEGVGFNEAFDLVTQRDGLKAG